MLDMNEHRRYHQNSGKPIGSLPSQGRKATVTAPKVGVKKKIHRRNRGTIQMNVVFSDCVVIFDCSCMMCFCCLSTLAFSFLSLVRAALRESALHAAISWVQAFICSLSVSSLFVIDVTNETPTEISNMKRVE